MISNFCKYHKPRKATYFLIYDNFLCFNRPAFVAYLKSCLFSRLEINLDMDSKGRRVVVCDNGTGVSILIFTSSSSH